MINKPVNENPQDNRKRPYPHYKFPDEITVEIHRLTREEARWYAGVDDENIYKAKTVNYGWFPTEAVMGKINGGFAAMHPKSKKHGSFPISGNCGSMGHLTNKPDEVKKTLEKLGYTVEIMK